MTLKIADDLQVETFHIHGCDGFELVGGAGDSQFLHEVIPRSMRLGLHRLLLSFLPSRLGVCTNGEDGGSFRGVEGHLLLEDAA